MILLLTMLKWMKVLVLTVLTKIIAHLSLLHHKSLSVKNAKTKLSVQIAMSDKFFKMGLKGYTEPTFQMTVSKMDDDLAQDRAQLAFVRWECHHLINVPVMI